MPAKAATTQPHDADLPAVWVGIESMPSDELIALEQRIGEILQSRNARPPINWSARVRASFARAMNQVREALVSNSFYTTAMPEEILPDSARVRACRSQIKRILHRLAPAEIIALTLYLEACEAVPLDNEYQQTVAHQEAGMRARLQQRQNKHAEASA
jgi:hypothetical protein